ncbi:hypothetical protein JD844_028126 [Phrynosoma platyrhinos]|uniref:NADH dehydrogenase [ubiquinone] 1 alpha subcomplex subunit 12 n=1 Tax=Phrynosoma platyrhinos TaxID=52577 RepID=A0ABQ7SHC6_PHRPL|nr:hypothetical protein JD844_028126 [Phrynosoma platyrhinos]
MAEYVQVAKRALQQLGGHGGIRGLLSQLLRSWKGCRHRWVIYTEEMNGKNTFWELDGSMVPPEWHRWLHCMTEDPPTTHPPVPRKFIWENHKMNLSGTPGQYVPYSTTRKKIQEWIPPSIPSK